jgi:hypothetical protein
MFQLLLNGINLKMFQIITLIFLLILIVKFPLGAFIIFVILCIGVALFIFMDHHFKEKGTPKSPSVRMSLVGHKPQRTENPPSNFILTKEPSAQLDNADYIVKDIEKNGALIIDKPWIELLLSGQKVWEMRATKFKKSGYIALIAKGTKTIVGIAKIQGFEGPLSVEELSRNIDKHRVPQVQFRAEKYKWFVAMKLSDIFRLSSPIPYQHKSGSVIWVKLAEQPNVLKLLTSELSVKIKNTQIKPRKRKPISAQPAPGIINAMATKVKMKQLLSGKNALPGTTGKIPLSVKDKIFNQELCSKDGLYHIKLSSKEYRFESKPAVLNVLRKIESAQWATFDSRGHRVWQNTKGWVKAST